MNGKRYILIPFITGTDNNASITIRGATFQEDDNSTTRYPDPDFGAWLIEEIYSKKKILAKREGVFKKKYKCPSCNTNLELSSLAIMQSAYELKYRDLPSFYVEISVPSVVCLQCKKICGIDEDGKLSYHLNEAIIHAFESEEVEP